GGGGSSPTPPKDTATAAFSGIAFPGSAITLLKDSFPAGTTVAGPDAKFQISLGGLSVGTYSFSLVARDKDNLSSNTQSFTVSLTAAVITNISGVYFPLTLSTDKTQVKQGDPIIVFGQAAPDSQVNLSIHSQNAIAATTSADTKGVYFYEADTTFLEQGNHNVSSRSVSADSVSPLSSLVNFIVGTKNELRSAVAVNALYNIADVNQDGKVDIVDFSILAFWYKKLSPPARYDLNKDNKVDLVDLSIVAYNWTG
ncbi:TPA: hypothetical protein DCQ44_01420, partial [Candidatus Taylorbacteria bacterium]|nr:hypothetical protein [Candidatus Taylorbacteria bacterium]